MEGGRAKGDDKARDDLVPRIISALILVPLALLAAWLGGLSATLAVLVIAVVVFLEWAKLTFPDRAMLAGRAFSPFDPVVIAGLIALAAAALVAAFGDPLWSFGGAVVIVVVGAGIVMAFARSEWLAKGVVLAGQLTFCLITLRRDPDYGFAAVVVLLAAVWATDSFAYLVGRTVGGPKLWPRISPKKTWSGAIGGLAGGVLCGLLASAILGVPLSVGLAIVLALLSLAAEGGDLYESAVKRRFGVKDASHLIPGHGGMLDRVDGLLFASLAASLIGLLNAGARAPAIGRGLLLW